MIDVITKGYYEVWDLDSNTKLSQHSNPYKATIRAIEEKIKDSDANIQVIQPNLEAVADEEEINIELEIT